MCGLFFVLLTSTALWSAGAVVKVLYKSNKVCIYFKKWCDIQYNVLTDR